MVADLKKIVIDALNDIKAHDISTLEVGDITSITDLMIIATGTSTRHVKAIADKVIYNAKAKSFAPIGVEGEKDAEWILIDLGEVIVHVMISHSREFYQLEKLWSPIHKTTPVITA